MADHRAPLAAERDPGRLSRLGADRDADRPDPAGAVAGVPPCDVQAVGRDHFLEDEVSLAVGRRLLAGEDRAEHGGAVLDPPAQLDREVGAGAAADQVTALDAGVRRGEHLRRRRQGVLARVGVTVVAEDQDDPGLGQRRHRERAVGAGSDLPAAIPPGLDHAVMKAEVALAEYPEVDPGVGEGLAVGTQCRGNRAAPRLGRDEADVVVVDRRLVAAEGPRDERLVALGDDPDLVGVGRDREVDVEGPWWTLTPAPKVGNAVQLATSPVFGLTAAYSTDALSTRFRVSASTTLPWTDSEGLRVKTTSFTDGSTHCWKTPT